MTDTNELTQKQKDAFEKIAKLKAQANKLIQEATTVADDAKVAFSISMFQFSNTYMPTSGGETVVDEDGYEYEGSSYGGWQDSGC